MNLEFELPGTVLITDGFLAMDNLWDSGKCFKKQQLNIKAKQ